MARDRLPHIPWYIGDWRKDVGVQSLSYHHRGVWFEILMLMFESEQRGKLLLNGKPMPETGLARLLGLNQQELTNSLTILLDAGVASVCPKTSALMSRRMVRDEGKRASKAANGSKGGSKSGANREQKPDTDNDDESLRIIEEFCISLGLPRSDGAACFYKWKGNDWTNGGKPIKCWRSTIQSWKHAGYMPSQKNSSTTPKPSTGRTVWKEV